MKFAYSIIVILLTAITLSAQPSTITYQGKLLDGSGNPVTNPTQAMSFSIFSVENGGAALWGPVVKSVNVQDGMYTVYLGESSALSASDFSGTEDRYLEVIVGSTTLPRTKLRVVPYAFKALSLTDEAWASPGAIGTTTPAAANFTNVTLTGNLNFVDDNTRLRESSNDLYIEADDDIIIDADDEVQINGPVKMFGAWETKTGGSTYLATTDGFVLATASNSGSSQVLLSGYSDSSNPPSTLRTGQLATRDGSTGGFSVSFIMPVRKGDYWRTFLMNGAIEVIYWLPLGN